MARRQDLDALGADELYERGVAAARVGESGEARTFLLELTTREPDRPDAWLWLASVESNPQAKRTYFERVLALRPDDPDARAGLQRLAEKYGRGVLQDEQEIAALRCTWHPGRETALRCSRCGRPMCPECAREHPVGWRCKECAKELRSPLYKVGPVQLARAFVAALAVSVAAAALVGAVSAWFWFVSFFLAAPAGAGVAEVASAAGARKRGRTMQAAAAGAVVVGALLVWLADVYGLVPGRLVGSLGLIVYAILGGAAAYARLR